MGTAAKTSATVGFQKTSSTICWRSAVFQLRNPEWSTKTEFRCQKDFSRLGEHAIFAAAV
jgi:hypothetical protein